MKSLFSFFQPKKSENYCLLDIGTEAVKALIFKKEDEKIIILGASRKYFDEFGIFDSRDFEREVMKKAISEAIKEAKEKSKVKTNSLILGLPANFLKGKVIFQNFRRENPRKIIEEKEAEEIEQKILKDCQKKIFQAISKESGILPKDIQVVDFKILDRKIDGYSLPSLVGFTGQFLELRILLFFIFQYYYQNFEKIFRDLNLEVFRISHPAQNLGKIFGEEKISALIIDIGGRLSQIFLIKDGKLESVDDFAFGARNFSEILSQTFGLNMTDSRIWQEKYSQGLFSEGVGKKIREIFSSLAQVWFENLKSKILTQKGYLSTIFLFGGGSLIPEIEEILSQGDWRGLPLSFPPKIKYIYPKDLKNIEDRTQTLNSPADVSSMLLLY